MSYEALLSVGAVKLSSMSFKFVDLFAGIGGFHGALSALGGKCVFASEIDKDAARVYLRNWGIMPEGDITALANEHVMLVPKHDVLVGGFPCQPFSQAGFKKGFEDTRGTLFFDIAEIIKIKKPKAFFLENVRGLYSHDNGRTFQTIKEILTEDLGYSFHHAIVKASDHGLPQHRPRLFMVGFRNPDTVFEFPKKRDLKFNMSDVMNGKVDREIGYTLRVGGRTSPIDDRRNWDGYRVNGKVRRLTPREGLKMQGFPASYKFPVSDIAAMKQLGNSVAVAAIHDYAKQIINSLDNPRG